MICIKKTIRFPINSNGMTIPIQLCIPPDQAENWDLNDIRIQWFFFIFLKFPIVPVKTECILEISVSNRSYVLVATKSSMMKMSFNCFVLIIYQLSYMYLPIQIYTMLITLYKKLPPYISENKDNLDFYRPNWTIII